MFGRTISPAGLSPDEVMTIHMDTPAHEAASDAFVAEDRASSDLVSDKRACLTTPGG